MLVGCGEDIIGEYIDQYDKPTEKEVLTYNLYIVCGDETSAEAKTSIRQRIADYTEKSSMRTLLNVVFCSATEYETLIKTATDANTSYDSNNADLTDVDKAGKVAQADIFLITSAAMMDEMVAGNRLANLTEFLNGDYEYGKFNAQIAESLLNASLISDAYFAIPNNYVVGDYTYLSVNINEAAKYYFSELDIERKNAGVFGTEYFWMLVSALGENPLDYISYVEDSQISDQNLLAYEYDYVVTAPDPAKNETDYTYLLFGKEAAAKYNISYAGITTIAQAREMYQTNTDKTMNISKDRFDEIFKVITTASELSAGDLALLTAKSNDYFNKIVTPDSTTSSYIFFDKAKCDALGLNNNSYFANCDLPDETPIIQLWNAIKNAGAEPTDYIKLVKGSYDKKAEIEAGDANGRNICNVVELPSASKADAFSGAFAVNANVKDVERAMEVIYAINNDITLHNYLQYGIPGTNYNFVGDKEDGIIVRSTDTTSRYVMNPRYTGNLFGLYYCEEFGWMPSIVDSAKKQNDESIFKP